MSKPYLQRDSNPFPNSDTNKRYYTYDYYNRITFGGKCAKIVLDAGFTCPNIDGKCGTGGCIYCSVRGSYGLRDVPEASIRAQFDKAVRIMTQKWSTDKFIAYFQAHTNTYAPVSVLREKFEPVLSYPGVVGVSVATRADCLDPDIVEYLDDLAGRIPLTVELGLQTSCDKTARFINRGHTYEQFIDGYKRLRAAKNKINICIHIIFGLPGETDEMMLDTVRAVAGLKPDIVKIHLLHIIKGTVMDKLYSEGRYVPLERGHYVRLVCDALELLPSDTVVERLTGDGLSDELVAPLWSMKKLCVINDIDKMLYERQTYQGIRYEAQK